ncbi:hypothetical protein ACIBG3_23975 [Paenibacillus glucanolyticus]|uniref:hypothetical protein n=1 Tax=Paenibacillus glucanolyticus TaxID=59843 RepID=UPI00368D29E0
MNKELRKRLKPMNSLTNIEAAEKIIYLEALDTTRSGVAEQYVVLWMLIQKRSLNKCI